VRVEVLDLPPRLADAAREPEEKETKGVRDQSPASIQVGATTY